MDFWITDHDRGGSVLSIRDDKRPYLDFTPVVNQMVLQKDTKVVTTIGMLSDEDLRDLKDAIDEHLQEKYGDAL